MPYILAALLFLLPVAAYSHDEGTPHKEKGQIALNLSVTESKSFEQDLLSATLKLLHEAPEARAVQQTINAGVSKALRQIKNRPGVTVSTGHYYVNPIYNYKTKKPVLEGYRGEQTLLLSGTEAEAVLQAVGNAQEAGFAVQGLQFSLSPQRERQGREGLIEAALEKLTAQAQRVAKSLGKTTFMVDELHMNTGGGNDYAPLRAVAFERAATADFQAPVAAAGEQTLSLTIQARVLVGP